jgi:hypothetical protein
MFTLQKRIVRIMVGAKPIISCSSLFKKFDILPIPCQYIFSIMNFIINNQENFQAHSSVHSINTRNKHNLHRTTANLSYFLKSTFCAGINIFNSLPLTLTNLRHNLK